MIPMTQVQRTYGPWIPAPCFHGDKFRGNDGGLRRYHGARARSRGSSAVE